MLFLMNTFIFNKVSIQMMMKKIQEELTNLGLFKHPSIISINLQLPTRTPHLSSTSSQPSISM